MAFSDAERRLLALSDAAQSAPGKRRGPKPAPLVVPKGVLQVPRFPGVATAAALTNSNPGWTTAEVAARIKELLAEGVVRHVRTDLGGCTLSTSDCADRVYTPSTLSPVPDGTGLSRGAQAHRHDVIWQS